MLKSDLPGYMEFKSFLSDVNLNVSILDLVKHADSSQIQTFGWPIAPVVHDKSYKPTPFGSGIKCIINRGNVFDYWTLSSQGQFYILKSLFEDTRGGGKIFFDTRIIRTTEVLWRTARLYKQMGAADKATIECQLEYGGLAGRRLEAANPMRVMFGERSCQENLFSQNISASIETLLSVEGLIDVVHRYCHEFFLRFDFFELSPQISDQIVRLYFSGRTS